MKKTSRCSLIHLLATPRRYIKSKMYRLFWKAKAKSIHAFAAPGSIQVASRSLLLLDDRFKDELPGSNMFNRPAGYIR